MEKTINIEKQLIQTLINGVKPALGCTEPVAVGLATAKAFETIKGEVKSINVEVSPNIYKNGMGVGIPGTKEIGLVFAAALGVTCGDPDLGLQVFKNVDEKCNYDGDVSYRRWSWNRNNTNFTMHLVSRKITFKEGTGREKPVELFCLLSVSLM